MSDKRTMLVDGRVETDEAAVLASPVTRRLVREVMALLADRDPVDALWDMEVVHTLVRARQGEPDAVLSRERWAQGSRRMRGLEPWPAEHRVDAESARQHELGGLP